MAPPLDLPGVPARWRIAARHTPFRTNVDDVLEASVPSPTVPEPTASADVTTSFVGLDQPTGGTFPPDTIVAKSPARVLEGVNSALRLSTTTGATIGTSTLTTFHGAPTTSFLFDPKVYFDRNATNRRFYVVSLEVAGRGDSNAGNDVSRIWLAVSRSTDPADLTSTNWCRYSINAQRNVGTTLASWADYPGLGVGADALAITTNQFRFTDGAFTFAIIRVMNKVTLANNAASCPSTPVSAFQPATSAGDFNFFTIQPAQHYTSPSSFSGTTNPIYFVNSVRPTTATGTFSQYYVWRIRNVASGSPTLCCSSAVSVSGSFLYGFAPLAPHSGGSVGLDTGDTRVLQVAGFGNALTAAHSTGCQIGGGSNEACVRVVRILVGQDSSGVLTAGLSQQRTFGGGDGIFYWMPGVAVNARQQTAVVFQRSSASSFLSGRWTMKDASATAFESTSPLTTGTCAQNLLDTFGRNRTGDYTGAQADPADWGTTGVSSFWLAAERATLISGTCQWQTHVIKVQPGTEGVNL